ncbi:hypothetical protein AA0313_1946 [Acetobacter indonesiensis NRIC 0313]|uniref:Adhesin/hemolysin n=1 Tax=Acetobacter indonesiensis TaxID=104101 RepID=A0A6N3T9L5_9PROT|nr:hypothetical protein [Acetobacter indonesiensis]GAN64152.1 adhesin/hemolysin [Acetobacter indonesiensis]GBQ58974.1 hypothetical protein AA0313_1946 [Acetobacter indonesiensis NRIC 0313]GEN04924.1 hypothetical protein AIN02nite_29490 [Acetobacter indonesiensis]
MDTATGESYEVKNYNIAKNSSGLISNVIKQIIQRASQLPKDTQQNVVIDVRGQNVSRETAMTIVKKIIEKSNGILSQENITFKGTLK